MEVSAKGGVNISNLFNVIAGFLPGNESHRVYVHEDPRKDYFWNSEEL